MEKTNENEVRLTVLDVLKSNNFENHLSKSLNSIKIAIREAENKCGKGQRLKSSPILRLYKEGLLELQPFADKYFAMLNGEKVDLPSSLRTAIKDIGNDAFNKAASELIEKKAKEAANKKQDEQAKV